ncbi:hypothetical protein GCM10026988_10850 [Vibrio panuliri]
MTSIKQLIDTFQSHIPPCQIKRAFEIERSLKSGVSYLSLGGKKIRSSPTFIRFRLGRGFDLFGRITLMDCTLKR